MRSVALALASVLVALSTGCATITGSETQPLSITTQTNDGQIVQSAQCALRNDKGAWSTVSPGFVNVGRSAEDLVIECKKQGQPDGFARAISRAAGAMFGNIIFGGGIGALIDHSKGTGYNYPDIVPVRMGRSIIVDRNNQSQVQEEPVAAGAPTSVAPAGNIAPPQPVVVPVAASPATTSNPPVNGVTPAQSSIQQDPRYAGVQFPAPPVAPPPGPKIAAMSFEVEKLARANGCDSARSAELLTEPGTIETYRVRCNAGSELIIKCEYRNCRTLK